MRMDRRVVVAVGWLCLVPLAAAQEQRGEERRVEPPSETGAKSGAPSAPALPAAPPAGPTEAIVRGGFRSPARAAAAPDTTRVAQARLLSSADGTARLQFADGSSEVVKPGSVIGGDVVASVQGRQIILDRPAASGDARGEAQVVATFGADGRPRVRVFWTKDPSAVVAPEVR